MNHRYSYSKLQPFAIWRSEISRFTSSWLVPLLVWLAVIGMALAIAGLLLADE